MKTHDQLVKRLMRRPGVRVEVQRIEQEATELLEALLKARHEAGLTQAQVAKRMGTQPPAIARLESALATGKHSPSVATLRKYVKACGSGSSCGLHDRALTQRSSKCTGSRCGKAAFLIRRRVFE